MFSCTGRVIRVLLLLVVVPKAALIRKETLEMDRNHEQENSFGVLDA
jgi:hypothetical protein